MGLNTEALPVECRGRSENYSIVPVLVNQQVSWHRFSNMDETTTRRIETAIAWAGYSVVFLGLLALLLSLFLP
jgi:hypothetical protein